MKKFMLFIGGLVALLILVANLGPMLLLGVCVWLLYVVFKKFLKSNSTVGRIGWVILGLIILSIAFSNMFAVIGLAAAYVLYFVITNWKKDDDNPAVEVLEKEEDPFVNFERQWKEMNNY